MLWLLDNCGHHRRLCGCRAAWIRSVSPETFSPESCTLSGYWKRKFAEKGPLSSTNTIKVDDEGYSSLQDISAEYDNAASANFKGFYGDLKEVSAINPLGETGLSYCQCVAVAVSGCGVTQLDFQENAMLSTG